MQHRAWIGFVIAALLALGCDGGGGDDAGTHDAGTHDAGTHDASTHADAGQDAAVTPQLDCTQPVTGDLHTPPDDLPPLTAAEHGRLLKCGTDAPLDAATVADRARRPYRFTDEMPDNYTGDDLTHGATVIRVLYRSERRSGDDGFSSGTLYLPDDGASSLPLLVHVSGTTGMADACAPSSGNRFRDLERTLYVLLGRGRAVFVPDLIGLGTPGTLAYLEGTEAGRSVLDGARAALQAAPEGALSGQILISGHSAGGHAALSAQALAASYAPELNVLGVAGFAPVWFDTHAFATLLSVPTWSTSGDDGWVAVYGTMYFVGHAAAYDGEAHAYDPIDASRRDAIQSAFETYCLDPMEDDGLDIREAIEMQAANVGEIFDPSFRSAMARLGLCGSPVDCGATAMAWVDRFDADLPPLDPEGAPVWFHQGELDTRSSVDAMGCPIAEARFRGVDGETCFYTGTDHGTMATFAGPWLADWVAALASGEDAPACPDATPFPQPSDEDCGLVPAMDVGAPDAGTGDAGSPSDAGADAAVLDGGA